MRDDKTEQEAFWAGKSIDRHALDLVDYGFIYHRDNYAPLDHTTWFLLRKREGAHGTP